MIPVYYVGSHDTTGIIGLLVFVVFGNAILNVLFPACYVLSLATELLGKQEWWLVGHAAALLGELGSAAQPAIADLQRLLGHDHEYTRKHVQTAIERILSA
jgi:hypothetical protein